MGSVTCSLCDNIEDVEEIDICNQRIFSKLFSSLYSLDKEIGIGSSGGVYKCFRKSDSKEFAVKLIKKRYLNEKELIGVNDEIIILKRVSHKNIIKLFDIFDDDKYVFMILELCDNKDLFHQTIGDGKHGHFTESKAAKIIYKLSDALQYLHENGIVHRDIKPENILFADDGTPKITDFGLAHYEILASDDESRSSLSISSYMNTWCGTPCYVAPEIINNTKYNYKCDLWSLGVILYIMLVGYKPFDGDDNDKLTQLYFSIVSGKYDLTSTKWQNISNEAKDLIKCLLEIDPNKRYSAKDIKYHPWIKKHVN